METAARSVEQRELARGLAHEIRNPLNAIRLNLHILEHHLDHPDRLPREEVRRVLGDCLRETMQIETLVAELLGYVRPGHVQPEQIDLAEVVSAAVEFFRPSCEETELIAEHLPAGAAFPVVADNAHLRQAVLSLLRNALQAAGPAGRIEIRLLRDGNRARLSIADDGPVLPADALPLIFEPFFAGRGRNLGLSLALVRKQIQAAGGEVRCEPRTPGAAFFVELPLVG